MRIVFAADHAGYVLKDALCTHVRSAGFDVTDLGPSTGASVDYPDFAHLAAKAVLEGRADRAILVCGTGVGMAIAANRHRGIRAVNCSCLLTARMSRSHNDANVLAIGARIVGPGLGEAMVTAWLAEPFEGGRHQLRVAKMDP
jgi:ribose 5-phosphate isomerase B